MSSVSKSFFTNAVIPLVNKTMTVPVSVVSGINAGGGGGASFGSSAGGANELDNVLTTSYVNSLNTISKLYGENMANKNYESIPNSYQQYLELYMVLQQIQSKIKNQNLLLLLKLTQETLVGAINSYTIYGDNVVLRLDKTYLQGQIDTILSQQNQRVVELATSTGQLTITKTFKLAAVFNYYILIYGMPAYGVGFDPAKISYLVDILTKRGIDPYS